MSGKSLIEKRRLNFPRLPSLTNHLKTSDSRCYVDVNVLLSETFIIDGMLGKGALSSVYKARLRESGRSAALKVMHTPALEMQQTAHREFETLKGLDHPNIIKAFDILDVGGRIIQVLEYYPSVNLEITVRTKGRLQEATSQRFMRALWHALEHLATHGILHRDIKSENILVSTNLDDLKLIDFNVASTRIEGLLTPRTGDPRYMSPEVFSNSEYSVASDLYSAGLCLYFMLAAELPTHETRRSQLLLSTSCWDVVSESGKSVVRWSLSPDAHQRPTATQLLQGDWIQTDFEDTIVSAD